jgi:tRNA A37 threonylcarbamoyladenosine biosynthesis protein TsaE
MPNTNPLPQWLRTENDVKRTFELMGFRTRNISISGRQIDIVARKRGDFGSKGNMWVIEVTTEKVGAKKGGMDHQKLALAKKKLGDDTKMMLVTTAGFTDDQRASLEELGVVALTYDEFEAEKLDLRAYANYALSTTTQNSSPDIGYVADRYIDPVVSPRGSEKQKKAVELSGSNWIEEVLKAEKAQVCALLGGLGSGKTSLLQRVLELGCERYLTDPGNTVLPVFVPLGSYKNHSGDLMQMLMSQFSLANVDEFPQSFVRQLIDSRRIVLLLDGLDEIHPIQNSDDVLSTVVKLVSSIGEKAAGVVSCRRQYFESSADEMALFGSYTTVKLGDIQEGIARALRGHPTTVITDVLAFDTGRIEAYLNKRCAMSKDDIEDFFKKYYGFDEMAKTPVLLSMMATTIEKKLIDPAQQTKYPLLTLYKAYTDRWIERDVERARLSATQRRELSLALAGHMLWNAKDSEDWAYLANTLRKHAAWKENPLGDAEVELDIRRSGFLIRDIDDRWRFIHRSIMEYFAAEVELAKLVSGERPRHYPSDGFQMFLGMMMAREWQKSGRLPFPAKSWYSGRGDRVVSAQMSMLAAGSQFLADGERVEFRNRGTIRFDGEPKFQRVDFIKSSLVVTAGDADFDECTFDSCKIEFLANEEPIFYSCRFKKTEVVFGIQPAWKRPTYKLEGRTKLMGVPGWVWDMAALVDDGATVRILDWEWNVNWDQLTICADILGRLKGKIQMSSLIGGPNRNRIETLIPVLEAEGLIQIDRSRPGHQVKATKEYRNMIGRLVDSPKDVQDRFKVFD